MNRVCLWVAGGLLAASTLVRGVHAGCAGDCPPGGGSIDFVAPTCTTPPLDQCTPGVTCTPKVTINGSAVTVGVDCPTGARACPVGYILTEAYNKCGTGDVPNQYCGDVKVNGQTQWAQTITMGGGDCDDGEWGEDCLQPHEISRTPLAIMKAQYTCPRS